MRIALVQMSSGSESNADNVAKACDFIDKAAKERPDMIVLPELFNTGYFCMYRDLRNFDRAERDDGPSMSAIKDKARQHKTHIVAPIYEEQAPGLYYNTAMLVDPEGAIVGKFRKIHPAAQRSLEKLYYRNGTKIPLFNVGGFRMALLICYDLVIPETPRCAALAGAELIVAPFCGVAYHLSPNASNNPIEVEDGSQRASIDEGLHRSVWKAMTITRATENGVYLAACNHGGKEYDSMMAGGSIVVEPTGRILAFAEEDEGVIWADADWETFRRARINGSPQFRDRRPDLYKAITTEMDDLPL